ncbi:acylneuraminate cytidylyltransferase [Flagellimonas alvinocaridis]|uniref:N-acylneuraminate cytidylyltransferase n=1 Tax=Flagellimonas alvinocaridis TaxID=2530200 RepID=A0A4S8RQT7_9FLAO|nr:acylneuraminate cytidylyltransferase [Allomuricauda alvinocaridis]THV60262.1 acylneuraminate cytidylyltransferase [Allomuricauda alvinocaridis]
MSKKSIGFIPLRKNSKGIPGKNKKKLLGRPLFTWVLTEAIFSNLDEVYVFTDDDDIIDYISQHFKWAPKVKPLKRSDENASDTASTEAAMLEFCESAQIDFDVFCLLQATSPLTKRNDINAALSKLDDGGFDAVLSAVNTHRFTWSKDGKPLNYDFKARPRRQDFDGLLIENGAVYCTNKEALLESKNRLSGSIGLIEMHEETLVEIDSETDFQIIEQLLISHFKSNKSAQRINHFILDVDGVFTDGSVTFNKEGEFSKCFDMRDGMGLEVLREHGVNVMVMTSENSQVVGQRMKKLKIADTFLGIKDKYSFLEHLFSERNISPKEIAYIGDDVNDWSNILRAGWSFCPSNATKHIKHHADMVLKNKSAQGAIREACEFIINYNLRFNDL